MRLFLAAAVLLGPPMAAHAQSRVEAAGARVQAEAASLSKPLKVEVAANDLSAPVLFRATPPEDPRTAPPRGAVKTSLDHAFSPSGSVMGSVGYLCGLQPGPNETGGAISSFEPVGTFLGGQFRLAF